MTDTTTAAPARPTFLGSLAILESTRYKPRLELSVSCSFCRKKHFHEWNVDPADVDSHYTPTHRVAHCSRPGSPFAGLCRGYLVAPRRDGANARVLAKFAELLRQHRRRIAAEERRNASVLPAKPYPD